MKNDLIYYPINFINNNLHDLLISLCEKLFNSLDKFINNICKILLINL